MNFLDRAQKVIYRNRFIHSQLPKHSLKAKKVRVDKERVSYIIEKVNILCRQMLWVIVFSTIQTI